MASLEDTLVNFATAAGQAQSEIQKSDTPMLISLFEFQYQLNIDVKTNLDFQAEFGEGVGTASSDDRESLSAAATGGVATDKNVALMIHCVMQPPALAQGAAAQPAQVSGLQNEAQAQIQQPSSGGGSSGGGQGF